MGPYDVQEGQKVFPQPFSHHTNGPAPKKKSTDVGPCSMLSDHAHCDKFSHQWVCFIMLLESVLFLALKVLFKWKIS